ncbi:MAG: phosphotransferase [Methylomonas sp.]
MKRNILIHRPADLSKQWAQRIVDRIAADAKVSDICVQSVSIGTSTRLRVWVDHDAPELMPSRWFVKTPSLAMKSRVITALPRLLHKEIHFYRSFSKAFPVRLPHILAAQSMSGLGSTLVMTDFAELGFTPGQPSDALTVQQARRVIQQLAQFHGYHWNDSQLLKKHRWLGGFNNRVEQYMGNLLAVPLMRRGLRLAGDHVPGKLHASALRYAKNRHGLTQSLATGAQTLIHHDCHPGNLFWSQSQPGFLDWQLVRMGEGIGDVAYFLATSLEPDCRRLHEKELLNLYLESLEKYDVAGIDEQSVYRRYRAHLTYAFEAMIVTLAIGGMMAAESNIGLIRRASQAVMDHDSFAALADC